MAQKNGARGLYREDNYVNSATSGNTALIYGEECSLQGENIPSMRRGH